MDVPLEFESRSPFTQTVRIYSPGEGVELARDRVTVPPNDTRTVMLDTTLDGGIAIGSYNVTMEFETEDGMTPVQPETLDFEVMILTWGEAFQQRFSGVGMGVAFGVGSAVLLAVVLFGGGSLLNRFYLLPRLRVKGKLLFHADGDNPGRFEIQSQQINLGRAAKTEVGISFDSEKRQADFIISGGEFRISGGNPRGLSTPR